MQTINSFTAMWLVGKHIQEGRNRHAPKVRVYKGAKVWNMESGTGDQLHVSLQGDWLTVTITNYLHARILNSDFGEAMNIMMNRWGFPRGKMLYTLCEVKLDGAYEDTVHFRGLFDQFKYELQDELVYHECLSTGETRNGCKFVLRHWEAVDDSGYKRIVFDFGTKLLLKSYDGSHGIASRFTRDLNEAIRFITVKK